MKIVKNKIQLSVIKNNDKTPVPFKSMPGIQAIVTLNGLATETGIKDITTNINALFEGTGRNVGDITVDDTKDPMGLMTKLGDTLYKNSTVQGYLAGLPKNVAQDLCYNAVIAAIVTKNNTKVVPAVKFIPAQREYHQAQNMVYQGQKALNRMNPQSVRDSTVVIFQGAVQGMKKLVEISTNYPIIKMIFKQLPVHGFPTDIQGVKLLANMLPWERGAIIKQLDTVVETGLLAGNFRPDVTSKFIQKILGKTTDITDGLMTNGPFALTQTKGDKNSTGTNMPHATA